MRALGVLLVLAVTLSGCTGAPPAPAAPDEAPRTVTAEAAYPLAARAARALDPTARAVAVEPLPRNFPFLLASGEAPEWRFVFQFHVDPRDLEPTPQYNTVIVNGSTGAAIVGDGPPSAFRVQSRLPDGRAWLPEFWSGSAKAASALAAAGLTDPVAVELATDGCAGERAEPAWLARAGTGLGARSVGVSATTGLVCRDSFEPSATVPLALGVSPAEADVSRAGDAARVTVRAVTTEGPPAVTLEVTSVVGLDGAVPLGVNASFEPASVTAAPEAPGEAVLVLTAAEDAEPGRYTLYVFGRDEAGRATAGFTALVLRIR